MFWADAVRGRALAVTSPPNFTRRGDVCLGSYSPDRYLTEFYTSGPDQETGAPDSGERVAWWLALGPSVLGVVFGVMIVAWPEATLKVVAVLFGAWPLLHGVVRIVQAITGTARNGAERALARRALNA
jgi:Short repeat of unknown function (DUF308)